jgi:hypothetical protein
MTYRIFISDELHILNGNISRYIGGNELSQRYYDTLFPEPEETRTPDEIIEGLKNKMRRL